MSDTDNDRPTMLAVAIDREQQIAHEIRMRALDSQAHAIVQLISTTKFTNSSIVNAVCSSDLRLLEQKNAFPQKGTSPQGSLIS